MSMVYDQKLKLTLSAETVDQTRADRLEIRIFTCKYASPPPFLWIQVETANIIKRGNRVEAVKVMSGSVSPVFQHGPAIDPPVRTNIMVTEKIYVKAGTRKFRKAKHDVHLSADLYKIK